jgi:thiamine-phosphate pyrophosphorylase
VRSQATGTRLLVNSRVDVAVVAEADGVHLRSDDVSAADARAMARGRSGFIVGVSCHNVEQVRRAWSEGADFAVYAPVFEKAGRPGSGLRALRLACVAAPNFVVALGGVTSENAAACLEAGAKGVAGIRLFQSGPSTTLVSKLRQAGIPKTGTRRGSPRSKSQT